MYTMDWYFTELKMFYLINDEENLNEMVPQTRN